jgi:hypothetical protein
MPSFKGLAMMYQLVHEDNQQDVSNILFKLLVE